MAIEHIHTYTHKTRDDATRCDAKRCPLAPVALPLQHFAGQLRSQLVYQRSTAPVQKRSKTVPRKRHDHVVSGRHAEGQPVAAAVVIVPGQPLDGTNNVPGGDRLVPAYFSKADNPLVVGSRSPPLRGLQRAGELDREHFLAEIHKDLFPAQLVEGHRHLVQFFGPPSPRWRDTAALGALVAAVLRPGRRAQRGHDRPVGAPSLARFVFRELAVGDPRGLRQKGRGFDRDGKVRPVAIGAGDPLPKGRERFQKGGLRRHGVQQAVRSKEIAPGLPHGEGDAQLCQPRNTDPCVLRDAEVGGSRRAKKVQTQLIPPVEDPGGICFGVLCLFFHTVPADQLGNGISSVQSAHGISQDADRDASGWSLFFVFAGGDRSGLGFGVPPLHFGVDYLPDFGDQTIATVDHPVSCPSLVAEGGVHHHVAELPTLLFRAQTRARTLPVDRGRLRNENEIVVVNIRSLL
ncbi:unnamed protein product [Pseudo-nitzschia multistriata]|uniref:Uncharacterized protein n=1 Tax=Pseudo-nitzschia multistriata TaxID=183589 RepID=A0A448Z606_9STRA|nr:unnamed protein product [Pseudo-nitzschia multistriata]